MTGSADHAYGQTTSVLVSNTKQSISAYSLGIGTSKPSTGSTQLFHTGSNASGYDLRSVGLRFRTIGASAGETITVYIYTAKSSGSPNVRIHTLTTPATLKNNTVNKFNALADATLSADTDYVLAFLCTGNNPSDFSLAYTASDAEDSGDASGWNVGDTSRSSLGDVGLSLMLNVRGNARNNPATGTVAITGTARVGETLTVDTSDILDVDGLVGASYAYQWIRVNGDVETEMAGVIGDTYMPDDADAGSIFKVRVTFRDDLGNDEALTSTATRAVIARALVSNTGQIRSNVSLNIGTVTSASRFTQLFTTGTHANGYDLSSVGIRMTSSNLSAGETVTFYLYTTTATDGLGSLVYTFLTPATLVAGVNDFAAPAGAALYPNTRYLLAVTGMANLPGDLLAALTESVAEDHGTAAGWGIESTYRLNGQLANTQHVVMMSVHGRARDSLIINNPTTGTVVIEGRARLRHELTVNIKNVSDRDGLTDPQYSYQWIRADDSGEVDISGATLSTYRPVDADVDRRLQVRVMFEDDVGNEEVLASAMTAAVTAPPLVSNARQHRAIGNTLIVANTDVSLTPMQLFTTGTAANGYDLSSVGINVSRLSPAPGDMLILYIYTVTSSGGLGDLVYTLTSQEGIARGGVDFVAPANATLFPETVYMLAMATALEAEGAIDGYRLTLTTSDEEDDDAAPGWSIEDAYSINGVLVSTGLPSLVVSINGRVRSNSIPNRPATGALTITGVAQEGQTLTVDTSGISDPDGLTNASYAYQWVRVDSNAGTEIAGAVESVYTPVVADVGKTLRVEVTFTDYGNNQEHLASAETAVVLGAPVIEFGASLYTAIEGEAGVAVTVTLGPAPATQIVVPLMAVAQGGASMPGETGADWSGVPSSLTFSPTQLIATFTVTATDDMENDGGEGVRLSFGILPPGVLAGNTTVSTVIFTEDRASPPPMAPETLVRNLSEVTIADPSGLVPGSNAQRFHSGPNGHGYLVDEIKIRFSRVDGTFTPLVGIHSVSEGNPGVELYAVTGTETSSAGTYTFSVPAGVVLHPDTAYFLLFSRTAAAPPFVLIEVTASNGQSGQAGWSIHDNYHYLSGGNWEDHHRNSLKIEIIGRTAALPLAPAGLGALMQDTQATLDWMAGDDGGHEIMRYEYRVRKVLETTWDPDWTDVPGSDATTTRHVAGNLSTGTAYIFEVRAVNTVGVSVAARASGTTKTVNLAPTFGTVGTVTRSVVENTAPETDLGVGIVATDADDSILTYTLEGANALDFMLSVRNGTAYIQTQVVPDHEVRANYALTLRVSDGSLSDTVAVAVSVTDEDEPPGMPLVSMIVAGQGQNDLLEVHWSEPTNTGPAITGYEVRYCKGVAAECVADADFTDHTHSGTASATTISGLEAATEYQVQVRATNAEGVGAWSVAGAGQTGTPDLSVSMAVAARVVEGGEVTVRVTLSEAPGRTVTVPLTVNLIGATPADYVFVTDVSFDATETSESVTFSAVADAVVDIGESVVLGFGHPLPAGITTGALSNAVVSIVDGNFRYVLAYTEAGRVYEVDEAVGVLTVTVRAQTAAGILKEDLALLGETVEVLLSTLDGTATAGSDYVALADVTLSWAPSDFMDMVECDCAEATKDVVVSIVDDSAAEGEMAESFKVALSGGDGQRVSYGSATGRNEATVEILDNDAEPMLTFEADVAQVPEGVGTVMLTALSSGSQYAEDQVAMLSFSGMAVQGALADYMVSATSLTLAGGTTGASATVTVTVIDDMLDENPEEETVVATLRLGAVTESVTITIVDDDDPEVEASFQASAYTAVEGGNATLVTVELLSDPERSVVIPIVVEPVGVADSDGLDDYSLSTTSVVFIPEGSLSQALMVVAVDDRIDDDGEAVHLSFGSLPERVSGVRSETVVSLTDNDTRGLTLSKTQVLLAEADRPVTETYTVTLDSQPTADVTVALRAGSTSAFAILPGVVPTSLTFTAGDWDIPQTVTLTVLADEDAVDERATVTHAVSGGDYGATENETIRIEVADDETVSSVVTLAVDRQEIGERAGSTQVVVTATLDAGAFKEARTVLVSVSAGADTELADFMAVSDFMLMIPAQMLSGAATFTLLPVNDLLWEPEAESVTVKGQERSLMVNETGVALLSDDDAPVLSFRASTLEMSETGGRVDLVVAITNRVGFESEQAVTLDFGVGASHMRATRGTDYTDDARVDDRLILAAGVVLASATVTLIAVNDSEDEDRGLAGGTDDESVGVRARHGGMELGTVEVTILDDDDPQVAVSYDMDRYVVLEEGETPALVSVLVSADPERSLLIPLMKTERGGASGLDYSGVPENVMFTSGQTVRTFTVSAMDDDVDDDGETLELGFSSLPSQVTAGTPAIVVIVDDDERGVMVSPLMVTIREGERGAYEVALASEPTGVVTVSVLSDNLDVTVSPPNLTFTTSNWEEVQSVTVSVEADADAVRETATLMHAASGADYAGEMAVVSVSVNDDDAPSSEVVLSVAPTEISESSGAVAMLVTAQLDGAAFLSATTVSVSVEDGSAAAGDYVASPNSFEIVIPANVGSANGTFTLTPTLDEVVEPDETVLVMAAAMGLTTAAGVPVTIRDDDTRGVSVSKSGLTLQEDSGASAGTYTVALTSEPLGMVMVVVSSEDATLATASPPSLTFAPGDWDVARTITVMAVSDVNGSNGMTRVMHAVSGADYGVNGVLASPVSVTVVDDETASSLATLAVVPTSINEDDGAQSVEVMAQLDASPFAQAVPVTVSVADGTAVAADYMASPNSFTILIPADARSASGTFMLVPTADGVDELDESVRVTGMAPRLLVAEASVMIADNDTRGVLASPSVVMVPEGESDVYGVALSSQPTGPVSVSVLLNDGDVTVSPVSLTFTSSTWNVMRSVTVSVARDADAEGATVTLTHVASGADYAGETATVQVVVDDVDTPTREVLLSVMPTEVGEGSGANMIAVMAQLDGAALVNATEMQVSIQEATASLEDYVAVPGNLLIVIPAGEISAEGLFSLTPTADDVDEEDETMLVMGTVAGLRVSSASVAILDDDARGVAVSATSMLLREGESGAYTVVLGTQPTGAVAVTVTAAGDVDVSASPGQLVFTETNWAQAQTVMVVSGADADATDDAIVVSHTVSGADYAGVPVESVSVRVTDSDEPSLAVRLSASPPRIDESAGAVTVAVTGMLDGAPLATETEVMLLVRGGMASSSDYMASSGVVLTIAAYQTEGMAELTVMPIDDELDEDDETVTVGGAVAGLTVVPAIMTILDDDDRGVAVSESSLMISEGGSGNYAVVLESMPMGTVTVAVSVSGDTDVSVLPARVLFTSSNWSTGQTVTVRAADDADAGADMAVVLHVVSGADYGSVMAASVSIAVADDDTVSTAIRLSVTPEAVSESAGPTELTVRGMLNGVPRMVDTEVMFTVMESADYVAGEVELTISAGSRDGTATLMLEPIDNAIDGEDAMASVMASTTSGLLLEGVPLTVMLLDDDERGVMVIPTDLEVREGDNGTYTMSLNSEPDGGLVRVAVSLDDEGVLLGAGVTVEPELLVFTVVDWAVAQTVTVSATDDATVEADVEAMLMHTVSGADYGDVMAVPVLVMVMVPGFEDQNGVLRSRVPGDGMVTVPEETSAPDGLLVNLPEDREDAIISIETVEEDAVPEGLPEGFRKGDPVVNIGLDGMPLDPEDRVLVCLPSIDRDEGTKVYFYENMTTPPEWVKLEEPEDGSPMGLVCGVTDKLGLFTLGTEPDDVTVGTEPDDVAAQLWLARLGRTVAMQVTDAVSNRFEMKPVEEAQWTLSNLMSLDGRTILSGSSFALPLVGEGERRWTVWGRGAYAEFDGEENDTELDGEVLTGTVGLDWERGQWLVGVAVSHSEGDGEVRDAEAGDREMEISLTGAHPYLRVQLAEDLSLWGVLGYGEGDWEQEDDEERSKTDLEMRMGAAGLRGQLGVWHGMGLALKSEVLVMRLETDEEKGQDRPDIESDAGRVRLVLEGVGRQEVTSGGMLESSVEVGARYDGGDAEEGMGVELGAGLRYADADGWLTAEGSVRGLLVHEESQYDEWGVSGALKLAPSRTGRGLMLHMGSSYGATESGAEVLPSHREVVGVVNDWIEFGTRFSAELGYGLNAAGGRGVLIPYASFEQQAGEKVWRSGSRLEIGNALTISLNGALHRYKSSPDERTLGFQISGRW